MTNPYRPPEAVVKDQDSPRGSPLKAVTFGVLVDIVGTLAASVILSIVYSIVLVARGTSPEEIAIVDPSSPVSLIGFAIGAGFSFLGGYVCARVARHEELKWASVVAVITVAIGMLIGGSAYPAELNVLIAILGIGAVMAGGYVGARQNLKG